MTTAVWPARKAVNEVHTRQDLQVNNHGALVPAIILSSCSRNATEGLLVHLKLYNALYPVWKQVTFLSMTAQKVNVVPQYEWGISIAEILKNTKSFFFGAKDRRKVHWCPLKIKRPPKNPKPQQQPGRSPRSTNIIMFLYHTSSSTWRIRTYINEVCLWTKSVPAEKGNTTAGQDIQAVQATTQRFYQFF